SWFINYSDSGIYDWYFNSSDSYGGVSVENLTINVNDTLLSFTSISPLSDPSTEQGTAQTFNVTLNRTANVTWYMNGTIVQVNESIISAEYVNSTAGVGTYNISAVASDIYDSAIKSWNWTVGTQSVYIVSGYVFDNNGIGLEGVLVQNFSNQNTTIASGLYSISGLVNGTYNFSYSISGFNTDYLEVTIAGADNTSANKTIYDTTPPASISSPIMITGNFFINNTWINPSELDFNHTMFMDINETIITNVSNTSTDLNLTWSPHYNQNISAQTVDIYGNTNQTKVWLNATIPNNIPVQSALTNLTQTAGTLIQFTVSATDADTDPITYGTNATNG
ncbi:MAG: carboxypeptidase-like regulatory domain-containing protein, partial [Candidatus Methanoperedens sp.]|nr:carboxypeptidase-like regulatory domain-containing protein [Candidatus Methanoperedens sp.]